MEPLKPELIETTARMVIRRAYAPEATKEEQDTGRRVLIRYLKIVIGAACEHKGFIVASLKAVGAGRIVASILAALLGSLCNK